MSAVLAAAACSNEHAKEEKPEAVYHAPAAAMPAPIQRPAVPADWQHEQMLVRALADSVDHKLRRVKGLSLAERATLRRDVNAIQIERAKQLGVRVQSDLDALTRAGKLQRLIDNGPYWVVRELKYSVPYVTPDARDMLVQIGERFQARLDSLGLPHYRLDITSVLRTPENHAALRRVNRNASQIESAHEFGTTVDIAYRRFAPPAEEAPPATSEVLSQLGQQLADSLLTETAGSRSGELQAVLGRVLQDMQQEGSLMVRMERQQTVYHITVARPMSRPTRSAG
jgi:hypothetical protein